MGRILVPQPEGSASIQNSEDSLLSSLLGLNVLKQDNPAVKSFEKDFWLIMKRSKLNLPKGIQTILTPKIHREDPHTKNHVAFTQVTTLKPSNQCPVKQSPEEKGNLKADTAAIRSTSTVPYDEREASPMMTTL